MVGRETRSFSPPLSASVQALFGPHSQLALAHSCVLELPVPSVSCGLWKEKSPSPPSAEACIISYSIRGDRNALCLPRNPEVGQTDRQF